MTSDHVPSCAQRLAERERPASRVVMRQWWNHLLFLHWEIDPELVQRRLPAGLTVDTFGGAAYLGVVPFFMARVRPVFSPPVPGLSWFQELNLRTYVYDRRGRPGVWFFSLDCNQWLAVKLARRFFNLPYQHARMSSEWGGGFLNYRCRRLGHGDEQLFRYPVRLTGSSLAEPGSLEFFLLERYRLFSADRRGRLYHGRVFHAPYQYQHTAVDEYSTAAIALAGFPVPGTPPVSAMLAEPVSVRIHALQRNSG